MNKILSEGTQMHSYDHFAPPLFFLLTSLFYLFLVKDELPSWASIFEPNILTLGLIFFALFLLFILFSGHLNFQAIQTPGFDISGAYVRKVVIHERGVLFYKNTREPLFLDWEELSKSSSDNYITGPLSQSMSEAIDSEVSRRRKEIMNAQMETYQQRQSEENTASEPTTEED